MQQILRLLYYFRILDMGFDYHLYSKITRNCPSSMYHTRQQHKKTSFAPKYKEKEAQPKAQMNSSHSIHPCMPTYTNKGDLYAQSNSSIDTCESERQTQRQSAPPQNHKVELCKNFISKGYCPYETRCRFAHGREELRARDADQSSELYRTRKCRVFFEKGECKFGQRCNFRHGFRSFHKIMTGGLSAKIRADFPEIMITSSMEKGHCSRLLTLLEQE